MDKIMLLFSIIAFSNSPSYLTLESLEYYQTKSPVKEFTFDFRSDYYSSHYLEVNISFFDDNDVYLATYSNSLAIIGNVKKIAKVKFDYSDDCYALIEMKWDQNIIENNLIINLYNQDDCLLDDTSLCDAIYLSKYENNRTIDYTINLVIDERKKYYLINNRLDLSKILVNTNYNFERGEIFLIVNGENEYPLRIDEKQELKLLENHFIDFKKFEYREEYFINAIKTNNIYFPYSLEYQEYDCLLYISDFIEIKIPFKAFTKGYLYGECSTSKYCLRRIKNA